jgi:tetratricopeptide (TPR) repeat protein
MPSHIFTRLGLWDESIASNVAAAKAGVAQAQRMRGGGGSFDQLHAMDYLVYAYLQEAKDKSAGKVLKDMAAIEKLDENQFAAAYAFAAAPGRLALERHDWKAAATLVEAPAWFPWKQFGNVEALIYYAKAIGAARAGDVAGAQHAVDKIDAIRKEFQATRDYDWTGSISAQWEAATALVTYAGGKREKGLEMLRAAADHEDAVEKHPVTPGSLLPVREMLGDLLLEQKDGRSALREYEIVLKLAPRRFNATAGAARAADLAGDKAGARAYAMQLLDIARDAETMRPAVAWAHEYTRTR